MKSFSEINRMNGTKGFRPDEHPTPVPNNDVRSPSAPKQSGSMKGNNPYGDSDTGRSK